MMQKQFKRMLSPKQCMPNTSASGQHSGLETFACALRFMVGPFLQQKVIFFFNSTHQIDIINQMCLLLRGGKIFKIHFDCTFCVL